MGYVLFGCQVLTGLVFVVAGITKLRDVDGFRRSMLALVPLPVALSPAAARALIGLELLVVALLVVPATVAAGLALSLILDLAFTVAIVLALRAGRRAPCACFGRTERPLGIRHVVRDLVLAAVALLGLVAAAAPHTPANAGGLLVAGLAGALGGLLVILLDDIVALFAPGPSGRASSAEEAW
ncbi:MauE/DoxX family redox-associated membrane protein [Dactylosporangium sp. NPDC000555]|uniref:MauE/DoxX family redox-associated membrane protein n=1 Tax=Dactylosporangium sp. NPDC000555 TaxID=3154260 RepID=UPI0033316297